MSIEIVTGTSELGPFLTRRKSEIVWDFINNPLTLVGDTEYNLVSLLKVLQPVDGSLSPFFDTTNDKMVVYNYSNSLLFKLSITGSWVGNNIHRSAQINFLSTIGNRLVETRNEGVSQDIITFLTFFSIDKNGNLATNGADVILMMNGGDFIVSSILLICEQVVNKFSVIKHQ